jgi:hypothetical protein
LTLGPSLRVAGRDLGVPLPFALVAQLPFFKGNRYPSRYAVMLLLCLAPLVALGALRIWDLGLRRVRKLEHRAYAAPYGRRVALLALLPALLLFEHLSIPLPLSDLRVPAIYDRVASQPGDFALLELPPGWRNGARVAGKQDIVIMQELWNQSRHGKRLLGGNTSRNPEFKFQYFSEDPTLARLIALTNAADLPQHTALRTALETEPVDAQDRARAGEWASFLNLRYVMVHRDKLPATTEAAARDLLALHLVAEEGNLALYEVGQRQPLPQAFDVGTDQGRALLAEGWSPPQPGAIDRAPVYAQRGDGHLLVSLPSQATSLRFDGWAVVPGQAVSLVVNGHALASQPLPQSRSQLVFEVPADPRRPVLSDVRLRFSALAPASQAATGSWSVGRTGARSSVSVLVRSAGQETGDFAHIFVNGVDLGLNARGYNVVALDPASGRLWARASFDTHADPAAGDQLAAWMRSLPPGAIVAGAVRDEASMSLSKPGVDALATLGVAADLRNHFRWGHAFIGSAGAPSGTALEAMDGIRPAQVSVGLPLSEPQVAAALVEIAVDK